MVAGLDLAVAFRGLKDDGHSLLLVTRGLPYTQALKGSQEAGQRLSSLLRTPPPYDGSGDCSRPSATMRRSVRGGRLWATTRVVGELVVVVLSPRVPPPRRAVGNAFISLTLCDAACKLLVGLCRSVDVTEAKLAARLPEALALVDELLREGLLGLPLAFAHTAGDARLRWGAVQRQAGRAARQLGRIIRSTAAGAASEDRSVHGVERSARSAVLPGPSAAGFQGAQSTPAAAQALEHVSFALPEDALPPPPKRGSLGTKGKAVPAVSAPAGGLSMRQAAADAFAGARQEEEEEERQARERLARAAEEARRAAEQAAASAARAADEGWATFTEAEAAEAAEAVARAQQGAPGPSREDVRDSLLLVELWHAEAVTPAGGGEGGEGALLKAGTRGMVRRRLAPFGLEATRFALRGCGRAAVDAQLGVAALNEPHGEVAGRGGRDASLELRARFTASPIDCCFLSYFLPAAAVSPPLQAQLLFVPGASESGNVLAVVRLAASPALAGSGLADLALDLALPQGLNLVKVSRPALWAREKSALRVTLDALRPGEEAIVRAVFATQLSVHAVRREAALRCVFTGHPGRTLSGVALVVGRQDEELEGGGETEASQPRLADRLGPVQGRALFMGELLVRVAV